MKALYIDKEGIVKYIPELPEEPKEEIRNAHRGDFCCIDEENATCKCRVAEEKYHEALSKAKENAKPFRDQEAAIQLLPYGRGHKNKFDSIHILPDQVGVEILELCGGFEAHRCKDHFCDECSFDSNKYAILTPPSAEEGTVNELKSSREWYELYPDPHIIDPDGWDRKNWDYSWVQEKITLAEFRRRVSRSTVRIQDFNSLINPQPKNVSEEQLKSALKEVNQKNREIRESYTDGEPFQCVKSSGTGWWDKTKEGDFEKWQEGTVKAGEEEQEMWMDVAVICDAVDKVGVSKVIQELSKRYSITRNHHLINKKT